MEWPPPPARHGGSRRDALRRLVAGLASVAAVLAGLALLVMDRVAPERSRAARAAVLDAAAPVWTGLAAPIAAVAGLGGAAGDYIDSARRVGALEARVAALRAGAVRADALADENRRLKRLLSLREPGRRRVAVARIAGASGAGLADTAILSAGRRHGVRPGQPVLADAGLLGRVVEAGATASRVLLVTDGESRVPVRVARTGAAALLAGAGGGMAELRFVEGPDTGEALRPGDRLFTSGEGGLFPPGVPVAAVVAVDAERARARPFARPSALGFAVVEAAWLPRLAPPAPRVAAR